MKKFKKAFYCSMVSLGMLFMLSGCGVNVGNISNISNNITDAITGVNNGLDASESRGEKNPYKAYAELYKTAAFDTRYLFYYMNENLGTKFNKERAEIEEFEGKNLPKVNIEFVDNKYKVVKSASSEFKYMGELKDNMPEGVGIIYQMIENVECPIIKGHFVSGSPNGYVQKFQNTIVKGWDMDEVIDKHLKDITMDQILGEGKLAINAFFLKIENTSSQKSFIPFLFFEGYFKDGKRNGEGILYGRTNKQEEKIKHAGNMVSSTIHDYKVEYAVQFDKLFLKMEETRKQCQEKEISELTKNYPMESDRIMLNKNQLLKQARDNNQVHPSIKERIENQTTKEFNSIRDKYYGQLEEIQNKKDYDELSLLKDKVERLYNEYINKIKNRMSQYRIEINEIGKDKSFVYASKFTNDNFEGKAKMFADGYPLYEGDIVKGELNKDNTIADFIFEGKGILYYPETDKKLYEGNIKNSFPEGDGIFYLKDGSVGLKEEFSKDDFRRLVHNPMFGVSIN